MMKIDKHEKLFSNINDKEEQVYHIRNLNQALNLKLTLKKVYEIVKSN